MRVFFRNNFGTQMTTPSLSVFVNRNERPTVAVVIMFFFWDVEFWFGDTSEVS